MDCEYGVNTANKFAFLMDDDHDPEETIAEAASRAADEKAAAEAELAKAKKKTTTKPTSTEAKKPLGGDRRDGKENRGPPPEGAPHRGGRGGLGGRGGNRGGGPRRPPPTMNGEPMTNTERPPVANRDQHRGEGGGRGEGMGRGVSRRGRFDRQSGSDRTGVKPHEKRQGAGKGNWGTIADELTGETEQLNVSVEGDEKKTAVEPKKAEVVEEVARPPQPEDNTMTLAQWKAQKQGQAAAEFNVRKVHMQRSMKEIHTKLDDHLDEEVVIVEKRAPKKQMVNIDINFTKAHNDGERGGFRGGRGARGAPFGARNDRPARGDFAGGRGDFAGGRGEFAGRGRGDFAGRGDFGGRGRGDYGGGRGGDSGGRGRGSAGGRGNRTGGGAQPNVDDLNSFPALG